ncbi:MAG TPA: hypothetical protein VJ719_08740 [Chthoniobacterales bacterium]|nr:hypothetical protein [Chthoniobacterales bacterium]
MNTFPSLLTVNRTVIIIVVILVALASAVRAQQTDHNLKQQILTQAQNVRPDDYAFTRTIRTDQNSAGKSEKKVTVERFDPRKPADQRWTLVSVDNAAPSEDELAAFRKDSAKRRAVPGYFRLAGYFGSPATMSTDTAGRTVFHFGSLPKDAIRVFDTDVSQNATAEALINPANNPPFVEQIRVTVKPMRIKLIMKLQQFESTSRYRMGSDGEPFLWEQTSDMTGAGMGREGRAHTVVSYSDYTFVGNK